MILCDVTRRTFQSKDVLGLFPRKVFSSLGEVQYSVMRARPIKQHKYVAGALLCV